MHFHSCKFLIFTDGINPHKVFLQPDEEVVASFYLTDNELSIVDEEGRAVVVSNVFNHD